MPSLPSIHNIFPSLIPAPVERLYTMIQHIRQKKDQFADEEKSYEIKRIAKHASQMKAIEKMEEELLEVARRDMWEVSQLESQGIIIPDDIKYLMQKAENYSPPAKTNVVKEMFHKLTKGHMSAEIELKPLPTWCTRKMNTWTKAEVDLWIESLKVSAETKRCIRSFNPNGAVLIMAGIWESFGVDNPADVAILIESVNQYH